MALRILSGEMIAAFAGAAMLVSSSGSSPAFTLASPSLDGSVAAVGAEPAYWHGGLGMASRVASLGLGPALGWGWGPGYGFGPGWRCWWTP
jgi:hypothetical protein